MSASLTAADVDRVAALAHLELTDEEKTSLARQLAEILTYAEALRGVDTTGVEPTAHVLTDTAFRDDVEAPGLARDEALANAPDPSVEAGLFRVPRVIG